MKKIYLYDTASRSKKLLQPLHENLVNLYVCGMTVYDYCHIGHAKVLVFFDTLVRYLNLSGYKVNYVRNITDVDDKIIKAAAKNNEEPKVLTTRFIQAALEDEQQLNVNPPDNMPLATEHIDDMLADIASLIAKDYAYVTTAGVYYKVHKKTDYGKLSGKKLADLIAGARVEVSAHKQNAADFALWKIVDKHELGWDSPWGYGRPGWHIECSSMSRRCLATDSIDIHGGGNDLIFPHHENEIAQSEAITGKQYVSTWMHTGHVCIDDTKMSKSLGNFFTIREVLKKYPGEAIRLFLLSNHYSSPINYAEHRLQEAHKSMKKFYNAIDGVIPILDISSIVNPEQKILQLVDNFYASLSDDINTPLALAAMFELCNYINKVKQNHTLQAQIAVYYFKQMANIFGILQQTPKDFLAFGASDLNISIIEKLIAERQQARLDKNWKLADDLRIQLSQQGVSIKDENGVTTWEKTCD